VGQGVSGVLTTGAPRAGAHGMRASRAGRLARGQRCAMVCRSSPKSRFRGTGHGIWVAVGRVTGLRRDADGSLGAAGHVGPGESCDISLVYPSVAAVLPPPSAVRALLAGTVRLFRLVTFSTSKIEFELCDFLTGRLRRDALESRRRRGLFLGENKPGDRLYYSYTETVDIEPPTGDQPPLPQHCTIWT
jgi:hypothetical protein